MTESTKIQQKNGNTGYEFDGRVRYSEIDHRGTMTLPALINYFQDCSTFHSEAVGLGMERLKHDRKAWVLSYWQVIVDRYPQTGREDHDGDICHGVQRALRKP